MALVKAQLSDGFSVELDEENISDNYELFEAYAKAQRGDLMGMVDVIDLALGADNKQALMEHLRSSSGRVSAVAMFTAADELIASTKAGKK